MSECEDDQDFCDSKTEDDCFVVSDIVMMQQRCPLKCGYCGQGNHLKCLVDRLGAVTLEQHCRIFKVAMTTACKIAPCWRSVETAPRIAAIWLKFARDLVIYVLIVTVTETTPLETLYLIS